jgi:hypothetical protein
MSGPCPICGRWWNYLAAHLWVAHGELVVKWLPGRGAA